VSTAIDRKQYGGSVTTTPEVEVGRPSSAFSRSDVIAVDIPLVEDSGQAGSTTNAVEKGEGRFQFYRSGGVRLPSVCLSVSLKS